MRDMRARAELAPGGEESTSPTVLGAQQAVEDLFHHYGVEFDELWQGLDHFLLQGQGMGGRSDTPAHPLQTSLPTAHPGEVGGQLWPHQAPSVLSSSHFLWSLQAELSQLTGPDSAPASSTPI